ncbi:MAG: hypothetical protein P4L71_06365 [Acetobacteraceae bacterium]|nr:hypothetical protein [Acetobacteraceae bacterium]
MSEMDTISARLAALETITRQLVTHLAIRADDPPRWVATRKALALSAADNGSATENADLRDAIKGFFDPLETVAADYAQSRPEGTPPRT